MGKKYIIELEEAPICTGKGDLYRAKGFNTLVFDANGIEKLERYNARELTKKAYEHGREYGYQVGMKDAADILKKVTNENAREQLTLKEMRWLKEIVEDM